MPSIQGPADPFVVGSRLFPDAPTFEADDPRSDGADSFGASLEAELRTSARTPAAAFADRSSGRSEQSDAGSGDWSTARDADVDRASRAAPGQGARPDGSVAVERDPTPTTDQPSNDGRAEGASPEAARAAARDCVRDTGRSRRRAATSETHQEKADEDSGTNDSTPSDAAGTTCGSALAGAVPNPEVIATGATVQGGADGGSRGTDGAAVVDAVGDALSSRGGRGVTGRPGSGADVTLSRPGGGAGSAAAAEATASAAPAGSDGRAVATAAAVGPTGPLPAAVPVPAATATGVGTVAIASAGGAAAVSQSAAVAGRTSNHGRGDRSTPSNVVDLPGAASSDAVPEDAGRMATADGSAGAGFDTPDPSASIGTTGAAASAAAPGAGGIGGAPAGMASHGATPGATASATAASATMIQDVRASAPLRGQGSSTLAATPAATRDASAGSVRDSASGHSAADTPAPATSAPSTAIADTGVLDLAATQARASIGSAHATSSTTSSAGIAGVAASATDVDRFLSGVVQRIRTVSAGDGQGLEARIQHPDLGSLRLVVSGQPGDPVRAELIASSRAAADALAGAMDRAASGHGLAGIDLRIRTESGSTGSGVASGFHDRGGRNPADDGRSPGEPGRFDSSGTLDQQGRGGQGAAGDAQTGRWDARTPDVDTRRGAPAAPAPGVPATLAGSRPSSARPRGLDLRA